MQAAILRVKLKYLDQDNAKRVRIAKLYNDGLADTNLYPPYERDNSTHVYHLYVVGCFENRSRLLLFLRRNGIGVSIHYPVPVHLQPAYTRLKKRSSLPVTESISKEILSLPMYPELEEAEIAQIISLIQSFHGEI